MMEKLLLYSILSSILGIFMGIFFSNYLLKKRFKYRVHLLTLKIEDKQRCLTKLEKECHIKAKQLDKIVKDSIVCKKKLLQTSNSLRKAEDRLYRAEDRLKRIREKISNIETIESRNIRLTKRVFELEKREKEINNPNKDSLLLEEFNRLKKIIEARDKEIAILKKREKLEELNFFKISKDQFREIEKRLKEYQERNRVLEREAIFNQRDRLNRRGKSIFKFKDVATISFLKDNLPKTSKA